MNFYVHDLEAVVRIMKALNDAELAALEGSPYSIPVTSIDDSAVIVGYLVNEVDEYSFVPRDTTWFDKIHTSHS